MIEEMITFPCKFLIIHLWGNTYKVQLSVKHYNLQDKMSRLITRQRIKTKQLINTIQAHFLWIRARQRWPVLCFMKAISYPFSPSPSFNQFVHHVPDLYTKHTFFFLVSKLLLQDVINLFIQLFVKQLRAQISPHPSQNQPKEIVQLPSKECHKHH